jgi:Zn-dependent peptidase ImmA (M78 family)
VISREKAVQLSEAHFPKGLEHLIKLLSITVEHASICIDGWCSIDAKGNRFIRLSTASPAARQRFTLAHEIAHFILGTKRSSLTLDKDVYDSKSVVEREANDLAAELLFPESKVREIVTYPVVTAKVIKNLAKKADASEIAAALRLAKLGESLGINRAVVIHFENGEVKWKVPYSQRVNSEASFDLYQLARESRKNTYYLDMQDDTVVVASALQNPDYPVLFQHLTVKAAVANLDDHESLREIEAELFSGDKQFQMSMSGKFGFCKPKIKDMSVDEAVEFFVERYADKWEDEASRAKFNSRLCRKYIRLRIEELLSGS